MLAGALHQDVEPCAARAARSKVNVDQMRWLTGAGGALAQGMPVS